MPWVTAPTAIIITSCGQSPGATGALALNYLSVLLLPAIKSLRFALNAQVVVTPFTAAHGVTWV
jgi:hypothetical protein